MSSLKPAWHIDRILALRAGEDIIPTHLHLIMSDFCNQNCHFCSYRMDGGFSTELFGGENPKRFMPTAKAKEILRDYHDLGGKAVQFQGGGEPTVHEDHLEIIGYAQSLGLETGLVTNGVRLKDHEVFRNLDWLRISLDAGTEETYEKIRESKAWSKVVKNLSLAASFDKPLTGAGFVVTRENYREIAEAALIVKDAGLSFMQVSALFSDEGRSYYRDMDIEIPDYGWIVDKFTGRLGYDVPPDYEFCGYQQFTLYIGADLNVYTCCANAYTLHGKIGDLKEQGFRTWIARTRRKFDARSCKNCPFHEQNRVINYLINDQQHVNFV